MKKNIKIEEKKEKNIAINNFFANFVSSIRVKNKKSN